MGEDNDDDDDDDICIISITEQYTVVRPMIPLM
jgi:hypothetical protein